MRVTRRLTLFTLLSLQPWVREVRVLEYRVAGCVREGSLL